MNPALSRGRNNDPVADVQGAPQMAVGSPQRFYRDVVVGSDFPKGLALANPVNHAFPRLLRGTTRRGRSGGLHAQSLAWMDDLATQLIPCHELGDAYSVTAGNAG